MGGVEVSMWQVVKLKAEVGRLRRRVRYLEEANAHQVDTVERLMREKAHLVALELNRDWRAE